MSKSILDNIKPKANEYITPEQSKRNAWETEKELEATGQESEEKAAPLIQEIEKRNEKERQYVEGRITEEITNKRKYMGKRPSDNDYYNALLRLAKKKLSDYEVAKGYEMDATLKDDGSIIFGIRKIGFMWFAQGMKVCGEPKYDMNCVERMVIRCSLAMDELWKQHEEGELSNGLKIPTAGQAGFSYDLKDIR